MKKTLKLVLVEWNDAFYNTAWVSAHLINAWEDMHYRIKSVGWLLKETKDYLILANGWREEDEESDEQFIGVHKIPKAWVVKRLVIK